MKSFKVSSIFVLLGALLAGMLTSCTSSINRSKASYYEKDYEIENFSMIKFEGAYNIELSQGDTESLVMETSEELHDKVRIWVSDDMLHIKTDVKNLSSDEIKLAITFTDLTYLNVEGGALLKSKGYLELEDLDIHIEGGANIKMEIAANHINAKAEGAVNMEFSGVAKELTAISEGAANIDADQLKAETVDCRVAGVGNASVYATDELYAKVEGLGKISYRGNPVLNKKIEGIGIVYKK